MSGERTGVWGGKEVGGGGDLDGVVLSRERELNGRLRCIEGSQKRPTGVMFSCWNRLRLEGRWYTRSCFCAEFLFVPIDEYYISGLLYICASADCSLYLFFHYSREKGGCIVCENSPPGAIIHRT